ncbi:MAG: DUF4296 domain-containing protein [Chitinophagaceae bacterium]|nr:DUF4296 domain-containing protein [Chitinophagaceae bacterium]
MKNLLLCCFVGIITACSNDKDNRIIPMDSMQVIMWDMMKADEVFIRKLVTDTNAVSNKEDVKLYETVFRIHQINKDRFFESYRYYEAHPLLMKEIIDSIDSKSNRERIERYSGKRSKP